jgi:hypothetical protein
MSEIWPSEVIPDPDKLFMRAHRVHMRTGQLAPGVFKDQGSGMSTNWQKYCCTPDEARAKARVPDDNAVVSLVAGGVRAVPLSVVHSPDYERLKLLSLHVLEIALDRA